jgi:sulfur-carrier protein
MSTIRVKFFGLLKDISSTDEMRLHSIPHTDALRMHLYQQYPLLQQQVFLIAVNHQPIQGNTFLNDGDEVALLPPFSGG